MRAWRTRRPAPAIAKARASACAAELALDYYLLRSFDAEQALLQPDDRGLPEVVHADPEPVQRGHRRAGRRGAGGDAARIGARAGMDSRLQRAQAEHAIAILTGDLPSSLTIDAAPLAGDPPPVPTELPSRLLERRPDIAAAERRVAAANADIGVATAAFFPTISLNASGGFQTTKLQQFLSWPSGFWSVGPALALTLFDGGARRAAKDRAIGAYDETVGVYRQTVLSAFADVEDNLVAVRLLTEEQTRQRAAVAAAQRALDISLNQYRAGLISYLQVAIEQAQLLNNQRAEVSVAARRYAAAVQLIRALGGGWDGRLE